MTLRDDIQALPDPDFRDLKAWIVTIETDRRAAQPAVEEAQAQLVEELWEQQPELKPQFVGTVDPDTPTLDALLAQLPKWAQPTSKASAYPPASLVQHNGRAWRNRRRGLNAAEPGTPFSGWEDVTDHLLKPVPVQDGNAEDANTTDAPGLITEPQPQPEPEPEPEPKPAPETSTPAPQVQEWYVGAKIEQGIPWLHDGQVYIAKVAHTASATNAPGKSTRHWTPLPA